MTFVRTQSLIHVEQTATLMFMHDGDDEDDNDDLLLTTACLFLQNRQT